MIKVRVLFLSNRTTNVEIREGHRVFGNKKEASAVTLQAHFVEFMKNGLKLDVPPRICSQGHRLEFELEITGPAQPIRFLAEGVVEHSECFPRSHDNIAIKFTRHDLTTWTAIQKLFRTQQ